ncbi:MAG: hypothetical protein Q9209_001858 [Squamulea sp. 1 TL-2023]
MNNLTSYCQTLPHHLKSELQRLIPNILKSLLSSPDPPLCSCEQEGNCHIKLITVINDDRTTYPKPQFCNCNCTPAWRDFHQRQLDLINATLSDRETQKFQLKALKKGIQQLLDRHREFARSEIRYEQYWLRQDYARTDNSRWEHNVAMRKEQEKRRRRALLGLDGESTAIKESAVLDRKMELSVESEDLYIDEDAYEFHRCGRNHLTCEEGQPESLNFTLDDIRRGQYLSVEEVLERFEDFKSRAAALIDEWEDEDTARAGKINAVYPWLKRGNCACTAELKLYHRCQNFGNPQTYGDLEAEMMRSDTWQEWRKTTTARRGWEVEGLLRSIGDHIGRQNADLEGVLGREGRRKAFVTYLRQYDPQIDLQVETERSHPSEALTLDLLRRADDMLGRWACEDKSRDRPVAGTLLVK